jgi:hypothetical protein
MNDSVPMERSERSEQISEQRDRSVERLTSIRQRASGCELHQHRGSAVVLDQLVNLHDVRMRDTAECSGFAYETAADDGVVRQMWVENLESTRFPAMLYGEHIARLSVGQPPA